MNIRRQLSLFVPQPVQADLEAVRIVIDPVQAQLIRAHVTLCREDELESVQQVALRARLIDPQSQSITLQFGQAEAFSSHGILLPCVGGEADFHALRLHLLCTKDIRRHAPHITLAHPRNPKAPGNSLADVRARLNTFFVTFASATLIQQVGNARWEELQEFALGTHRA